MPRSADLSALFLGAVKEAQAQPFVPPPPRMCNGFSLTDEKCNGCPCGRPHFDHQGCHSSVRPATCRGGQFYCQKVEYKIGD